MKTPQQIRNEVEKIERSRVWIIGLIIIVSIICGTLIYLNTHPYQFKIEMDDNTLEAIKSINWTSLPQDKECYCDCGVHYPYLGYNWSKYNWTYYCVFDNKSTLGWDNSNDLPNKFVGLDNLE